MTEIWRVARAGNAARLAPECERAAWDGLLLGDSQNRFPEVWIELAVASSVTSRLKIGTGVTNPVTRDAAVTAAAAATLQRASCGRAVLGIGRGDSSLASIGRGTASIGDFELYLSRLRAYLGGETIERGGLPSRLAWLPSGLPAVPIDVAASGPRVIALAARYADRLTFNIGAEPNRIRACVQLATQACRVSRRAEGSVSLGAYVCVAVTDDAEVGTEALRGMVATFHHFPLSYGSARNADDVARHGTSGTSGAALLSTETIRTFAVIGSPAECISRLLGLLDLGLGRLAIVFAPDDSGERFAREVLPGLRRKAG